MLSDSLRLVVEFCSLVEWEVIVDSRLSSQVALLI
jgi:hypothetical protein